MMMYASHLRVLSSPRHTQSVAASPTIRTAVIAIVHPKEVFKHRRNGAHDRTGAATGMSFQKRRLAGGTVPPMHPDRRWACAVSGTALQFAAKSSSMRARHWFLGFGLLCRHTASNPITTEMHTSGVQK